MRTLLTFIIILFPILTKAQKTNPDYDSVLAGKLGADERGMKMYVLVLLKTGSGNIQDTARIAELSASHFKNINKMAAEGKLVVAGPLDKNVQGYRGIFILDVKTISEAEALVNQDLSVKEGIFSAEYYNWYGSAALPEYIPSDKKLRRNLP